MNTPISRQSQLSHRDANEVGLNYITFPASGNHVSELHSRHPIPVVLIMREYLCYCNLNMPARNIIVKIVYTTKVD